MRTRSLACLSTTLLLACGDGAKLQPDAGEVPVDAPPDVCAGVRTPDPDPALEALLQRLELKMQHDDISGLAFAVLDQGEVTRRGHLGVRELGACEPITDHTRVRMGPALRTIDAIAALSLVAEGKLALDEPVKAYVPGFSVTGGAATDVTTRRLLDGTAGLFVPEFEDPHHCPSQDLTTYWATTPVALEHAPGAAIGSSREEISLLGAVIAGAAGKPYRAVIQERVLDKLGMTATFDHAEFLAGEHGRGSVGGGPQTSPVLFDVDPCGAWEPLHQLYFSLDDGIALARFLTTGDPAVLPAPELAQLRDVSGAQNFFFEYGRGYGLEHLPYDTAGTTLFFTDGSFHGTAAELDLFGDGKAVVYLANEEIPTPSYTDALISTLVGHTFEEVRQPLPVARWTEYAGTWHDAISNPPRDVVIEVVDNQLVGTFSGAHLSFTPIGEDSFKLTMLGESTPVRIWRDAANVPQLVTSQLGLTGPAFHRVP
jgi:CubicO group peptidase (beta-lactamase class C family)